MDQCSNMSEFRASGIQIPIKVGDFFQVCGSIAAKDHRMILTRGSTHFASLKNCVPSGILISSHNYKLCLVILAMYAIVP